MYAEACFETLRVIDGEIFAWQDHLDRLSGGLAAFGLPCPQGLLPRCLAAARQAGDDTILRLTVSGGAAPRGLMVGALRSPEAHVQAWPYVEPAAPLALRSLEWPQGGMSRTAKFTSDYAYTIRVLQQAHHSGHLQQDEQALFVAQAELLCMETANILLLMNGCWITPEHHAVLPGVVRAHLLREGVLSTSRCAEDCLQGCESMAICNSGCFVRAVNRVNGRSLDVRPQLFAPLTQALKSRAGVPAHLLGAS
ncbi:MAG: aminotransferase class IV [Mariprofundaceae bacterium]|nr:aminotransferase class IV [Mariprofundaceae bacterium]